MQRVLVIAPHGDDEVLGVGGTIAKYVDSGDHVTVAFLRRPCDERTAIQLQDTILCKKVLGYQNSLHLNIDEKIIANDKVYLIREFDSLLNQLNPNILYTPHHGDLHQDHRAVFEAVSSSSRVWSQNNIKQIFSYEIPSSSDQGYIRNFFPFIPTFYNPITQDHLIRKVEGMKCYSSEYSENPIHPRSEQALIEYAKKRGRECKSLYAEAFNCLRYICD